MSVFNQPEWSNFLAHLSDHPLKIIHYIANIFLLSLKRFSNRFILKLNSRIDPHKGLKQWPNWLGDKNFLDANKDIKNLSFISFPQTKFEPIQIKKYIQSYREGDNENFFAKHRWGDCVLAIVTGEESALEAFALAFSWIKNSPSEDSLAWETYSASERAVNLAVLLSAYPMLFQNLSNIEKDLIVEFFHYSARWIHEHLEYYGEDRTNNHILNNARALVILGLVLSNKWLMSRGLYLFDRMSKRLFFSNGALRERSSHYHLIVANWVTDIAYSIRLVGFNDKNLIRIKEDIEALAKKTCEISIVLNSAASEFQSYIGDISPDYHPFISYNRLKRLYPDYVFSKGNKNFSRYDDWVLARTSHQALMTCFVPNKYPSLYNTHGHNDLGNFLWAYGGIPILIDSGRANYKIQSLKDKQYRAAAHNTICINGLSALAESLLRVGYWLPKPYSSAIIKSTFTNKEICFEHSGFMRIRGIGKHKRSISLRKSSGIHIQDEIEGNGTVDVELFWHFAQEWEPFDMLTLKNKISCLKIEIEIETQRKLLSPTYEWQKFPYSRFYGDESESYMLTVTVKLNLPNSISTVLRVA